MIVDSTDLPNYEIPPMDSVGANEAIVDVTHGLVDFLSVCHHPPAAELNVWYHLPNCGFRLSMLGETDYPCFSGERPGVGALTPGSSIDPSATQVMRHGFAVCKKDGCIAATGAVTSWTLGLMDTAAAMTMLF